MSASTVYVKNISSSTSEKEVKDFFSFCGKITKIDITSAGETQNATVTFEKETAAKTALLLDNTQLGSTQVQVSSASGSTEDDGSHFNAHAERDSDEITQEEKPRSRIVAEYLAHGYVIGDNAIQQAINLDHKHGVSNRFLSTIQNLNQKYQVDEKAKSVDATYGVTQKTNTLWSGLNSYYEKAAGTPTGQKIVNFYTQTSRQVQDIHAEARRLADLKKEEAGTGSEKTCKCGSASKGSEKSEGKPSDGGCNCAASGDACTCSPGECTCATCPKSKPQKVAGTDHTTCQCSGNESTCACEEGKCDCAGCSK